MVILDHHKTALDSLPKDGEGPENLRCVVDMNRSGATISYDYFEEKLSSGGTDAKAFPTSLVPGSDAQQVKTLFKYIEDADLWRWVLADSKAFSSGLNDMGIEFNAVANMRVFDQVSESSICLSEPQRPLK